MSQTWSVEKRLLVMLTAIACVALAGVLALLPYRLYSRDIGQATTNAHRLSSIVHTALSHDLVDAATGDEKIADLVNRLQGLGDVVIRLRRLDEGEVHPAATSGRGYSTRHGTDLTYVSPPIIDREGRTWLASMYFDLSLMKQRSIRLILDLLLSVALGSLAFSVAIFVLVRRSLITPIRHVTRVVEKIADGGVAVGEGIGVPRFDTLEMRQLVHAVERACQPKNG